MIHHVIRLCLLALLAALAAPAHADPADIDAAARGVVRIVIIEEEDGELYPVAHGTGFAVTPERIVTNAHVVAPAQADRNLSIGIVPSDGGNAIYGRLASYSPRNDLALIATTTAMNLPVLTIAGNSDTDSADITAVGYPMNVDRAQGLTIRDIFTAQPPVKSRGYLSGRRPSREFDTLLHTAPIGQGSSGGPLLDDCGRVVGVNSFGAESGGADAEFYFAISTRELLPFLIANGITAQVNGLPCRSIAELDAQERARADRERIASMRQQEADRMEELQRIDRARRSAELSIISERDNRMMLSLLLIITALAAGAAAYQLRGDRESMKMKIALAVAGASLMAALIAWLARPGFDEVDDRASRILGEQAREAEEGPTGVITPPEGQESPVSKSSASEMICVVNVDRSRITSGKTDDIPLTWDDGGCVNSRTQYGLSGDKWFRVFVPQTEAAVSVSTYDPEKREYQVERFLLGHEDMAAARAARAEYEAPECGMGPDAASALGENQAAITSILPDQPNERLIYNCSEAP